MCIPGHEFVTSSDWGKRVVFFVLVGGLGIFFVSMVIVVLGFFFIDCFLFFNFFFFLVFVFFFKLK